MAQASSAKRTRSAISEDLVAHLLPKITGAKLPATRQVLSRFMSAKQHSESRGEALDATLKESAFFWDKAGIKTLGYRAQKVKLTRLWEEWRSIQKNKKRATLDKKRVY